jgi:hypothetical protein
MTATEQTIERAKKILALATRGVGGEKTNAEKLLTALLAKHGLTLEDLGQDTTKPRSFQTRNEEEEYLIHHCTRKTNPDLKVWKSQMRGWRVVDATDYEYIQISEMYEFHRKNYAEERKRVLYNFDQAYYAKHDLFIQRDPGSEPPKTTPSPDIDLKLIQSMAGKMTKQFRKAIAQPTE